MLCALVLSAAGGAVIADTGDWVIAAGLLGGGALVGLGMLQPALFVAAVLVVRPLMDGATGSATAAIGVVVMGVCGVVLATRPRIVAPAGTFVFSALLLVSAMSALPSMLDLRDLLGSEPLGELVRLGSLFSMYVLATQVIETPDGVRNAFLAVGLSGVVPAASALAELAGNPEEIAHLGLVRVSGTFVNPVALSSYLALSILVLLMMPRGSVHRWVRWPALGIMIAALIASYGREGWGFLLLAIVILTWRERQRVIVGMVVVIAGLLVAVPGVRDRVLPNKEATGSETASTFASYDWRLANWRGLLGKYAERPFTGWGLESVPAVNPRKPLGADPDGAGGFQAHNAAVRAIVEGGPLLLLAVLAFLMAFIRRMWRMAPRGSPLRPYARTLGAAWLGLLVVAVSTNDLLDATALMYAILGLSGAVEGAYARRPASGAVLAARPA